MPKPLLEVSRAGLSKFEGIVLKHSLIPSLFTALLSSGSPLFTVEMECVETNILRFFLDPRLGPDEFCARMAQVGAGEEEELGQGIQVLMFPHFGNSVRAVWHLGISSGDTQLAAQKMKFVAAQVLKETVGTQ